MSNRKRTEERIIFRGGRRRYDEDFGRAVAHHVNEGWAYISVNKSLKAFEETEAEEAREYSGLHL